MPTNKDTSAGIMVCTYVAATHAAAGPGRTASPVGSELLLAILQIFKLLLLLILNLAASWPAFWWFASSGVQVEIHWQATVPNERQSRPTHVRDHRRHRQI